MKKMILVMMLLLAVPYMVDAQGCSVCTKTAAGLDDKSAKGLNAGIIYLAFLPLTIMGTVGIIWWRRNHVPRKSA